MMMMTKRNESAALDESLKSRQMGERQVKVLVGREGGKRKGWYVKVMEYLKCTYHVFQVVDLNHVIIGRYKMCKSG